jgi:hypothetical protein
MTSTTVSMFYYLNKNRQLRYDGDLHRYSG